MFVWSHSRILSTHSKHDDYSLQLHAHTLEFYRQFLNTMIIAYVCMVAL